ncbi:hypothetical protein Goari_021195 [Gossypium aridum]|uniref:Uncharacterized protein n=1 Tax=Gossypium aridum TaxID=34290 RepID=A0A7J8YDK8_GOSAI|nr:hypothetical protein [Gossypium aridum]
MYGSGGLVHQKRRGLCLSVEDRDRLVVNSSIKDSGDAEKLVSDDRVSALNPPSLDNESRSPTSEPSNGSMVSSTPMQEASSPPNIQSTTKKISLTAKERLRAARVLSRYAESKLSKSEMGSNVLDAMRESDKGKKRSRLPEAPTNLFDDSKRGMPKQGLTFQFPGGNDLLVIIFSVVFISTVLSMSKHYAAEFNFSISHLYMNVSLMPELRDYDLLELLKVLLARLNLLPSFGRL